MKNSPNVKLALRVVERDMRDTVKRLNHLQQSVRVLRSLSNHGPVTRVLSASARRKISEAQKARWAKVRNAR
jgi:hypothetical protein